MSAPGKRAWCAQCAEPTDFYEDAEGASRCSLCETKEVPVQPLESAESAGPNDAPAALPLLDDLDHIRIQLSGPWSNEDLKALADDLTLSAEGAKEGGLGLAFFAVKKSAAAAARAAGGVIVPFRDRNGNIIPGRTLDLRPGAPRSMSSNGIILPGDK